VQQPAMRQGRPRLVAPDRYVEQERSEARRRMASLRKRRQATSVSSGPVMALTDDEIEWVLANFCADKGQLESTDDSLGSDVAQTTFDCVDRWDRDVAPCAPPDVREVGNCFHPTGATLMEQRRAYWKAKDALAALGQTKKRQYVPGFHYLELPSSCVVISAEQVQRLGRVTLNFVEADGSSNMVRVAFDTCAADAVALFGRSDCVGKNHVRGKQRDGGTMVAWGDHVWGERTEGVHRVIPFANSREETKFTASARSAAIAVSAAIKRNLPDVAEDFRRARRIFPRVRDLIGGDLVVAEQWANSVDLFNTAHIDWERVCFVQWAEDRPGQSKNWFLLFPNVRPGGLAVQLGHGIGVSWVGELHPHCTPITNVGDNNHTYGMWTGVKNDMWNEYNC
jgi:hypothetical protein